MKKDTLLKIVYTELDLLREFIRESKKKTLNIVEPKLTQYGLSPSYKSYDFEVAKLGIKERISGILNGYYTFKPIEDIKLIPLENTIIKSLIII
jgi:hypothetical protein